MTTAVASSARSNRRSWTLTNRITEEKSLARTTFDIRPFDALSVEELYDILYLRNRVFVAQQEITAEPDVDGRDPDAHHAMLWLGAGGAEESTAQRSMLGTARIFVSESASSSSNPSGELEPAVIGRVAVDPNRQRQGHGTELMKQIQSWLGDRPAELHAQAYLQEWYEGLGWS